MTGWTRRGLLKTAAIAGAGGVGLSAIGRLGSWAAASPEPVVLQTAKIQAKLMDVGPTNNVLTYGNAGMPPVLRMKKGEPFAARLINAIDDPTTIHWHGIRVPNKMDGVPFLVQSYVYAGDHFDYTFTPPDAGTFWYHPHCNTLEQMGHGLTGVIVVENPNDPKFDAEFVVNLRDCRLGDDGQFIDQFRPRDAARTGTYGTVRTANWLDQPQYDAPAGGLVRLRVAITDVTRIYAFRVDGAEAMVMALDGNPVPERFSPDALLLGPGQRMELAIRMPDQEGAVVSLRDVRGPSPKSWRPCARRAARSSGTSAILHRWRSIRWRRSISPAPSIFRWRSAPRRKTSRAMASAVRLATVSGPSTRCRGLAIHPIRTAPLAELKLGKSYVIDMENLTPQSHPMHLHGMSFKVLSSSTRQVEPLISDTYLIQPNEKVSLGFVADNPGDWLLHCHIIEHQKSGMTSYVRVV